MDKTKRAGLRLLTFTIGAAATIGLIYGGSAIASPDIEVQVAHLQTIVASVAVLLLL